MTALYRPKVTIFDSCGTRGRRHEGAAREDTNEAGKYANNNGKLNGGGQKLTVLAIFEHFH